MSLENEDPAGWRCPAPGCNREFGELWRLRQHYRQPAKGSTAATRGHGAELVECPRCKEPLSLLKNARHRCKLAPARLAAAAAAAATQARLAGGASQEGHVEDGPANKRRRVRWQGVSSGVSDSGGSSGDGSEEQELEECDAEDGKRPASGAAAVVAAAVAAAVAAEAEAAEPLPTLQARLPLPHPTPRSSTAAALLVRISSGAAGAMPSPLVPLQVLVPAPTNAACAPAPPALPVVQAAHAAAAPSSGIRWWQAAHAVGEAEAEGFVTLIVRHTADRQAGGRAGAGSGSLSQQAQQDSLLAALVAELTVRCTAVRQLLDQQRQRELAEGVRAALNAARLAAAVGQLSALLARQQAAGA
ncbi:hypothetical protein ABPG75_009118 [Micractinium tetrahymenae]